MTQITESKKAYPEIKFFKELYSVINVSESVTFFPKNETIHMLFSKESKYYVLTGKLFADSYFSKWLSTVKAVTVKLSDISMLSKILKKNLIDISYEDSEYFTINYKRKEDGEVVNFTFNNQDVNITEFEKFLNYSFKNELILDDKFLENNICAVYLNEENELTEERTKNKVIEIPSAKILSIIKNGINTIFISERNMLGTRIVGVSSKNENFELIQYFNTI